MASGFHPGALLGRSYPLADGVRVRLRMARPSDVPMIQALLERRDGPSDAVHLSRLVHFDPQRRCVLCATALIDGVETLVGVGAIGLDDGEEMDPDTLIVAGPFAEEVAELLAGALIGRAAYVARAA